MTNLQKHLSMVITNNKNLKNNQCVEITLLKKTLYDANKAWKVLDQETLSSKPKKLS